jgi:hypothetical protein
MSGTDDDDDGDGSIVALTARTRAGKKHFQDVQGELPHMSYFDEDFYDKLIKSCCAFRKYIPNCSPSV